MPLVREFVVTRDADNRVTELLVRFYGGGEITIPTTGTAVTMGRLFAKPRTLVDVVASFPADAPDISDVTLTALCRFCHRPVTIGADVTSVVNSPVYCARPDCKELGEELARQAVAG
ncbi:MAG TPA: hypothetical protein VF761_16800 [Gemmatimonadaceae bacterium]